MKEQELLPHLFRAEYRKIISVLCATFGIEHIAIAEDIVSDTFLSASEQWGLKGLPQNPVAWLYTVAKNKTRNYLKRNSLFAGKLSADLRYSASHVEEMDIDLSAQSINDSQLAMIFTVCNPCIPGSSQIALALNLLCGFGIGEIADAFLTNKEVIYKRLTRAKEKLKQKKIKIEPPTPAEMDNRLDAVLTTLYLLFSEGYYATGTGQNTILRKDLCAEAMRLNYQLLENTRTRQPAVNALFSLMCFHTSRFAARTNEAGMSILYEDQDTNLWDADLIRQGIYYLNQAAEGNQISRYHLEAGIAYWHTHKEDSQQKWENILQLYNQLLQVAYSPIAALNRTFALAKANGIEEAITEAEKLQLTDNPFYYTLLGKLYMDRDPSIALQHFKSAVVLTRSDADKALIISYIERLSGSAFVDL